jgi:hypothetical protein
MEDGLMILHGFENSKEANSPKPLCSSCFSGDDIESGFMDTSEQSIGLVFGSDDLEADSNAKELWIPQ